MRQRDAEATVYTCHDPAVSISLRQGVRIPKFAAQNCAAPRCHRLCLTYFCDEHYPRLGGGHDDLARFLEITQACHHVASDRRHYARALYNFFDCATLMWNDMTPEARACVRDLLEANEFHDPQQRCDARHCDLFRRYAFMVAPNFELPPETIF